MREDVKKMPRAVKLMLQEAEMRKQELLRRWCSEESLKLSHKLWKMWTMVRNEISSLPMPNGTKPDDRKETREIWSQTRALSNEFQWKSQSIPRAQPQIQIWRPESWSEQHHHEDMLGHTKGTQTKICWVLRLLCRAVGASTENWDWFKETCRARRSGDEHQARCWWIFDTRSMQRLPRWWLKWLAEGEDILLRSSRQRSNPDSLSLTFVVFMWVWFENLTWNWQFRVWVVTGLVIIKLDDVTNFMREKPMFYRSSI